MEMQEALDAEAFGMQMTLSSACTCLILPTFSFDSLPSVKVIRKEHLRMEEAGSFLFYSIKNASPEGQTLSIASLEIHSIMGAGRLDSTCGKTGYHI